MTPSLNGASNRAPTRKNRHWIQSNMKFTQLSQSPVSQFATATVIGSVVLRARTLTDQKLLSRR
jgi:hypothetical protein